VGTESDPEDVFHTSLLRRALPGRVIPTRTLRRICLPGVSIDSFPLAAQAPDLTIEDSDEGPGVGPRLANFVYPCCGEPVGPDFSEPAAPALPNLSIVGHVYSDPASRSLRKLRCTRCLVIGTTCGRVPVVDLLGSNFGPPATAAGAAPIGNPNGEAVEDGEVFEGDQLGEMEAETPDAEPEEGPFVDASSSRSASPEPEEFQNPYPCGLACARLSCGRMLCRSCCGANEFRDRNVRIARENVKRETGWEEKQCPSCSKGKGRPRS